MQIDDARAGEIGAELAALARNSYAPYSRFHVAALALTEDGQAFPGVNMENASYGLSLCAETNALAAATTGGGLGRIAAIAIIGGRMEDGELVGDAPVLPCGRCRQLINESASLQGRDIQILAYSGSRRHVERTSINELLPHAFGPGDLE
ncbi:MAG: cytidine deaminase [Sphingosinicella sp.]|nr:cytidine deaminase [Sphingosinicella sp.]